MTASATRTADLARAKAQSAEAREAFRAAADAVIDRISPARLKADAAMAASQQIDEVKTVIRQSLRSHPLVYWSGLALLALLTTYIVRHPATALVRRGRAMTAKIQRRFVQRTMKT